MLSSVALVLVCIPCTFHTLVYHLSNLLTHSCQIDTAALARHRSIPHGSCSDIAALLTANVSTSICRQESYSPPATGLLCASFCQGHAQLCSRIELAEPQNPWRHAVQLFCVEEWNEWVMVALNQKSSPKYVV